LKDTVGTIKKSVVTMINAFAEDLKNIIPKEDDEEENQ